MATIDDMVSSIVIPSSSRLSLDETIEVYNAKAKLIKETELLNNKLQADLKSLRDKLSTLDKERAQVRKDVTKLKEEDAGVTAKILKLRSDIKDIQYKINKSYQRSSITEKSQGVLKQNRQELSAYREFTGLRWNFNTPDNVLEGLITNSQKNFVKTFHYEKSMPTKKIRESLWNIIKEAGSAPWDSSDENKENQANQIKSV